ncbi:Transcriptional regulator, MerR family [hydrothermal vent metagenome]|uniref:Transcriptional regulator, MerR family n=1 Tax=hydrothermal vent metagenome TaxID=652676 RepID=A0A3B0YAI0_9ZZZZ
MMDATKTYRISEIGELLGLSADTLRYYEKIGLLKHVVRTPGGARVYSSRDLSRLRFIRRAQSMNFSLAEIGNLLEMREDPQHARDDIRLITRNKLTEVETQLKELKTLRNELKLLVDLCRGDSEGCPIIEGIDQPSPR